MFPLDKMSSAVYIASMRTDLSWVARPLSVALGAGLATFICLVPSASAGAVYPSPDPGGDETLEVSVPPPSGKTFGFVESNWGIEPANVTAQEIAKIGKDAGANAQRFEVTWWAVQPTPGEWDEAAWARYQRMYDALDARGMRPVITVGFAPPWARDSGYPRLCTTSRGCEYPPASHLIVFWREFVAEVARRFPNAVIEIWNEPNMANFWKPYPQPERYAFLVAHAYAAIKEVRPNTTVLAGALAPAQANRTDATGQQTVMSMRDFLERAYAAPLPIKGSMDALSFHTTFQELDYGQDTLFAKAVQDMRSVPSGQGDAGRRLWITESGISTLGSNNVSAQDQASGLLRQYRRFAQMPDVDGFLINTLLQDQTVPAGDHRKGYGVVEEANPLRPKLAYCAFANRAATPTTVTSCAPGIFMPGEGGDSGGGGDSGAATRCENRLAQLKAKKARLRSKIAVYLPSAQAGYPPSKRKVRELRKEVRKVKAHIVRKRARCRRTAGVLP